MANKKMADSAILQARDLTFSPKILKKYLKNRFENKMADKNKMADSAILRARNLKFSPNILKKYL